MKKTNLKLIIGTTLILSALTNTTVKATTKIKKSRITPNINFKIKDKSEDQSSISDGSKTERSSK